MSNRPRRNHSPAFVAKVALAAVKGELTLANDVFRARARQSRSVAERKAMIDRSHALPLTRRAEELGISRGSLYRPPQPVPAAALAVMRRMDGDRT